MALITSVQKASATLKRRDVGPFLIKESFAISSTLADSGDDVVLFEFPRAGTIIKADLSVSATLGASCTAKLAVGDGTTDTDVTGATTAGGASKVNGASVGPISFAAGAKLLLTIGGADIAAAATALVHLLVEYD